MNSAAMGRNLDTSLRRLVSFDPPAFCTAVLSVLGSDRDPVRRRIYDKVADYPEFWLELLRPNRFDRAHLLEVCRYLLRIDNRLDVRLAHLTAGREEPGSEPDPETVLRVLDVVDALSPGNRLILLLNHLTTHSDRRIASKATLVVGRRLRNPDWVARHLDSDDGRVRANTLEGLWGTRSPAARDSLFTSLRDKNNRVVGNALIGLHELGEPGVNEFVKQMIHDARPPFRWTAAWVMGRIGAEEFIECLEQALQDKDPQVQRAAGRALEAILQHGCAAANAETSTP